MQVKPALQNKSSASAASDESIESNKNKICLQIDETSVDDDDDNGDKTNTTTTTTTTPTTYASQFTIEGFISTCAHNSARSAPDRQYIYINKRPCEHTKLVKLINEQFHLFNRNQYPMFVLNISTQSTNVDVNVTPDKLQMFVKNEATLMAIVKSSLNKLYTRLYNTHNVTAEASFNFAASSKSSALMASFITSNSSKQASLNSSMVANKTKSADKEEEPVKIQSQIDDFLKQNSLIESNKKEVKPDFDSVDIDLESLEEANSKTVVNNKDFFLN